MPSCGIQGTNSTTGSPATTPGSQVSSSTNTAAGTRAITAKTRRPSSLVASGVRSATAANAARLAIIHPPRARTVPSRQSTGRARSRLRRVVCRQRNRIARWMPRAGHSSSCSRRGRIGACRSSSPPTSSPAGSTTSGPAVPPSAPSSSTCAGRSPSPTAGRRSAPGTSPAPSTSTSIATSPTTPRRGRGGIRCRRRRPSPRRCAGGGCATTTPWWSWTTSGTSRRRGPGGCCGTRGSPTCGCSTVHSRPGSRRGIRSRPARRRSRAATRRRASGRCR